MVGQCLTSSVPNSLKAPTALTSVLPALDYSSHRDLLFFLFQPPGRYFLVLCSGLEGYRLKHFTRQVGSRPLRFQLCAHTISNENLKAGHFVLHLLKKLEVEVRMMSDQPAMESSAFMWRLYFPQHLPAAWCQGSLWKVKEPWLPAIDQGSAFSGAASEVVLARPACPWLMLSPVGQADTPLFGAQDNMLVSWKHLG